MLLNQGEGHSPDPVAEGGRVGLAQGKRAREAERASVEVEAQPQLVFPGGPLQEPEEVVGPAEADLAAALYFNHLRYSALSKDLEAIPSSRSSRNLRAGDPSSLGDALAARWEATASLRKPRSGFPFRWHACP